MDSVGVESQALPDEDSDRFFVNFQFFDHFSYGSSRISSDHITKLFLVLFHPRTPFSASSRTVSNRPNLLGPFYSLLDRRSTDFQQFDDVFSLIPSLMQYDHHGSL